MAKIFAREKEERKKKRGGISSFPGFFALPDLPIYGVLDDDGSAATWRTESALFIYCTVLFSSIAPGGSASALLFSIVFWCIILYVTTLVGVGYLHSNTAVFPPRVLILYNSNDQLPLKQA